MTNKERILSLKNNFEVVITALGNVRTEDFPKLNEIIAKFRLHLKYCSTISECFHLLEDKGLKVFADHYDREYLYNMSLIENAGIDIDPDPKQRTSRRASF